MVAARGAAALLGLALATAMGVARAATVTFERMSADCNPTSDPAGPLYQGALSWSFDGTSSTEQRCSSATMRTMVNTGTFSVTAVIYVKEFSGNSEDPSPVVFPILDDLAMHRLELLSSGRIKYEAGVEGQGINCPLGVANIPFNTWHQIHIACASSSCNVYINGVQKCTADTFGTISVSTADVRIGSGRSGNDEFANGYVRSVAFRDAQVTPPTPTGAPTALPTALPTKLPTKVPTTLPTTQPTSLPTTLPTTLPTRLPTRRPTVAGETWQPTSVPIEGSAGEDESAEGRQDGFGMEVIAGGLGALGAALLLIFAVNRRQRGRHDRASHSYVGGPALPPRQNKLAFAAGAGPVGGPMDGPMGGPMGGPVGAKAPPPVPPRGGGGGGLGFTGVPQPSRSQRGSWLPFAPLFTFRPVSEMSSTSSTYIDTWEQQGRYLPDV